MPNHAKKKELLVKVSRGGSRKNISKRRCRANSSPFYQNHDFNVYANLKSDRSAKSDEWFVVQAACFADGAQFELVSSGFGTTLGFKSCNILICTTNIDI